MAFHILEAQIRECFARVVYSHKTHEKCADLLLSKLHRIKLVQIILSAIIAGGFITIVFDSGKMGATIGVGISVVLLTLNAYVKDYNLGEMAQQHRQAASALWLIRERYLSLLADIIIMNKTVENIQMERDNLAIELQSVYKGCPSTNDNAYKKAQKALKISEEMTFSTKEIDAFLPEELKRY